VVRQIAADARVVYVDNDPMVRAYAGELLTDSRLTTFVFADLRDPGQVLGNRRLRELIDFTQPVGLLMTAVLHFVADGSDPWGLVKRYTDRLAPGSLLALSGVLLQALFRNPLADPYVLGVSGGAAVGALLAMIAGAAAIVVQSAAVGGALAAVGLVYLLARGGGTPRLLLTGVVLASACGALVSVLLALADSSRVRGMVFWLAGDLEWAVQPWLSAGAAVRHFPRRDVLLEVGVRAEHGARFEQGNIDPQIRQDLDHRAAAGARAYYNHIEDLGRTNDLEHADFFSI